MDYTLKALKSFSGLEFSYSPETGEITIHKGDANKDEVLLKAEEIKAAEPLRQLRQQRNQLLAQSDWRMVSDYPGSNQTEWQTYRQALRDITTQTPSLDVDGNLTGITWPTPPND